ncbi:MAG: hypothetical protein AAGF20_12245 [Pseudomonadota bacterium]
MSEMATNLPTTRSYWLSGLPGKIATGLTGIIAVFVALKAISYQTPAEPLMAHQDNLFRLMAFAALTVWVTLTIGTRRRGAAAMITLAFASFADLIIAPAIGGPVATLPSANLGIVLAYCAMHLYALVLRDQAAMKPH